MQWTVPALFQGKKTQVWAKLQDVKAQGFKDKIPVHLICYQTLKTIASPFFFTQ